MSRLLLTGATGFVGQHVLAALRDAGHEVRCAVRGTPRIAPGEGVQILDVGSIGPATDWRAAVAGVDCVVHLAARAHILEERSADPRAAFLAVNTEGTLTLARASAAAGVRRLVFMSSIKVNGEDSGTRGYAAADAPAPADDYGYSKMLAEQGLGDIARATGLEVVVLRPPLVYGPGVGANFLRLMKLVDRGLPLPLGSVRNQRSLVSVWNLADLLLRCLAAPEAANRTFMVSDGVDLSTADLARRMARALGRRARLVNVPTALLRLAARLTGQMAEYTRLCASLRVDMDATVETLGWRPPCSQDDGFERTVRWYRDERADSRRAS